jgi:hypothetical protein
MRLPGDLPAAARGEAGTAGSRARRRPGRGPLPGWRRRC